MRVRNFTYNGFYGQELKGYAPYRATFKEWTDDPGVAICVCTDGVERRIPTFALEGFRVTSVPRQRKTGVLFDAPCSSRDGATNN